MSDKSIPVLCVLDVETTEVSVPKGIPEHISPGQVSVMHRGKLMRDSSSAEIMEKLVIKWPLCQSLQMIPKYNLFF